MQNENEEKSKKIQISKWNNANQDWCRENTKYKIIKSNFKNLFQQLLSLIRKPWRLNINQLSFNASKIQSINQLLWCHYHKPNRHRSRLDLKAYHAAVMQSELGYDFQNPVPIKDRNRESEYQTYTLLFGVVEIVFTLFNNDIFQLDKLRRIH